MSLVSAVITLGVVSDACVSFIHQRHCNTMSTYCEIRSIIFWERELRFSGDGRLPYTSTATPQIGVLPRKCLPSDSLKRFLPTHVDVCRASLEVLMLNTISRRWSAKKKNACIFPMCQEIRPVHRASCGMVIGHGSFWKWPHDFGLNGEVANRAQRTIDNSVTEKKRRLPIQVLLVALPCCCARVQSQS